MPIQFLSLIPAFLLLPGLAAAAGSTAPDIGSNLLQLVFGFMLILALLFATLWLLKKISVPRGGPGNLVRVVSAAPVGPRERVVLVDVGGKRLVLGVAPGHVALLDTQTPPITASTAPEDGAVAMPAFAQWLSKNLAKRNEK